MLFRSKPVTWFWSNGSAWGTFEQKSASRGVSFKLTVLHGQITLDELTIAGAGTTTWPDGSTISAGQSVTQTIGGKAKTTGAGRTKKVIA